MKKINLLFVGSGSFAVPILESLTHLDNFKIVGVVTQPDKPVGRRGVLTPSLIGQFASKAGLLTFKPEKLKEESADILRRTEPSIIIVADYGQIIPNDMLEYPRYKCINIHGSILPDLRGAVPIPISILRGYKNTGISIIVMTPGLDDGDVIATQNLSIDKNDTTESLKQKLAILGAKSLEDILYDWTLGKLKPVEQRHDKATYVYAKDISKENAFFDSSSPVDLVERMVRAYNPWPIAWTNILWNQKKLRLKVFEARLCDEKINTGEITYTQNRLLLGLFDGTLEITKLQLEGKSVGDNKTYSYLHGAKLAL